MIPSTTVKDPETGLPLETIEAGPLCGAPKLPLSVREIQSVPLERCEWVTVAGQLPVKLCATAALVKVKTATTKVIAMDRMCLVILLPCDQSRWLRAAMKHTEGKRSWLSEECKALQKLHLWRVEDSRREAIQTRGYCGVL